MVQFHGPKHAREWAQKSYDRMSDLGLTPYPENFTVWFNYHAGRDDELTTAVNTLVHGDSAVDDEQCYRLYDKFFGRREREDALYTTSSHIEQAVDRIIAHIGSVTANTKGYGQTLSGFTSRLSADVAPDQIRAVVAEIATETRRMEERNHDLEAKLDQSTRQITELKANLEKVQVEALTDGLTGVGNRKGFDEELFRRAVQAMEEEKPLSVLLLDIDHFKGFNDKFGHLMGDQVLKLVGRCLTTSIKGRDFAGRYGGEEFGIILPNTALKAACIVAEQIRELIASKKIVKRSSGEVLGRVTVSIGIAEYVPGEPLEDTLRRADTGLYAAKRAGRNRICLGDDSMAEGDMETEAHQLG
jgi:diguanylate cyclase